MDKDSYNAKQYTTRTVVYKNAAFKGLAHQRYEQDLKKRQKNGWQLISCTESGRTIGGQVILTAIYEKGNATQQPAMDVQNLALLLSMLTPQERSRFEGEVQIIVNRYLAVKATMTQ